LNIFIYFASLRKTLGFYFQGRLDDFTCPPTCPPELGSFAKVEVFLSSETLVKEETKVENLGLGEDL